MDVARAFVFRRHVVDTQWLTRRINIMHRLKYEIDRKSLEIIFTTFIRPILEYTDVICDNCSGYEKQELEKMQTEANTIAIGAT